MWLQPTQVADLWRFLRGKALAFFEGHLRQWAMLAQRVGDHLHWELGSWWTDECFRLPGPQLLFGCYRLVVLKEWKVVGCSKDPRAVWSWQTLWIYCMYCDFLEDLVHNELWIGLSKPTLSRQHLPIWNKPEDHCPTNGTLLESILLA